MGGRQLVRYIIVAAEVEAGHFPEVCYTNSIKKERGQIMVMVFNKYMTDETGRTFIAPYNEDEFAESHCPSCGSETKGEGVFATGAVLGNYEPYEGEKLKNLWAECSSCGWNEYS